MSQSKTKSLIESITNTVIGMLFTFAFSPLFYWMCDVELTYAKMGVLTLLFTILSILRNFFIRRIFIHFEKPQI